jgi:hypothetical protein
MEILGDLTLGLAAPPCRRSNYPPLRKSDFATMVMKASEQRSQRAISGLSRCEKNPKRRNIQQRRLFRGAVFYTVRVLQLITRLQR